MRFLMPEKRNLDDYRGSRVAITVLHRLLLRLRFHGELLRTAPG